MGTGPLQGIRVIELASLGPGTFTAMMLADMGADVIRLERPGGEPFASGSWYLPGRGRPSVECDLKTAEGRDLFMRLVERADVLIEGFRPGVMERLGIGPDEVAAHHPGLIYGRMTGYGQDGPMSPVAGHDINYLALSGVLSAMRRAGQRPHFPLNLLANHGGGGMLLAFGVLCALWERTNSGQGQVVDAAMVDGVALLSTTIWAARGAGLWSDEPGSNLIDTGAPFYDVYETADNGFVAIGAMEPHFYAELLRLLGLDAERFPQMNRSCWPALRAQLIETFASRSRDEWAEILERSEVCATPVYGFGEAPGHPHHSRRSTFIEVDGVMQPAPAPRFSRSTPGTPSPPAEPGAGAAEALASWGL